MAEKVPKTIALGLTKRAADGRIISINHPNPTGKVRNKRQYRSLKNDRIMLLPKSYQARDANAQNGQWQCPVHGCDNTFTRKAGLLLHMERPNGHKEDLLRDTGNGTFTKIDQAGDMRQGHKQLEDTAPQPYKDQTVQDKKSKSASEGEYIDDENVWLNASHGEDMHGYQLRDALVSDGGDEMDGDQLREALVSDGEEVPQHQHAESLVGDGGDGPQCQTTELKFKEWQIREEFENEFQADVDWVLSIAEGKYDLQRK
ncbi:hypothetical protein VE00_01117 [Pseudogymnoascus sp. WSF 3629]|nr:hypothetical protein VE00_01117 [Pseudogymnoascus sp. WSF 3629]